MTKKKEVNGFIRVFVSFILGILIYGNVFAQSLPLSAEERGIIQLQYYALKLQVVEIENDGWMFWGELEKEKWPEAFKDSFKEYDSLKAEIQALNVSEGLRNTQKIMVEFIDKTKAIYGALHTLNDEQMKEKFKEHQENVLNLSNAMQDTFKKYYTLSDASELKIIDKELELISDKNDKNSFLNAVDLLGKRKCKQSKVILVDLLKKYKNTPFEASILIRIIDCQQIKDSDLEQDIDSEKYQELALKLLERGEYSPVLFDLFGRWRTVDQMNNHGMSNMSEIPNDEYLKVQWKVAETIIGFIEKNPKDVWAKQQLPVLMTLGNIERGGEVGNLNMNYIAHYFYPDMGEKPESKK